MPTVVELGPKDKGRTVDIRRGDIVEICLPENPTTGYQWSIDRGEATVVALEESEFSRVPDARTGRGGWRKMRFRARTVGTAQLRLTLSRPWERDTSIIERYEVTLHIEG